MSRGESHGDNWLLWMDCLGEDVVGEREGADVFEHGRGRCDGGTMVPEAVEEMFENFLAELPARKVQPGDT